MGHWQYPCKQLVTICCDGFKTIISVDGEWGSWQAWSTCSKTCGGGEQSRIRDCDNPPQSGNGTNCTGAMEDTQTCNNFTCPRKSQRYDFYHWKNQCNKFLLLGVKATCFTNVQILPIGIYYTDSHTQMLLNANVLFSVLIALQRTISKLDVPA